MNRREEPLPIRTRKKMTKEIRKAEKDLAAPSIRNLRGQNLAQRKRKVVKREQGMLAALKKNLKIQDKKKSTKHSKRSAPGPIASDSSPRHPHIEGERWIKTVQRQNLSRAKKLSAKLRRTR